MYSNRQFKSGGGCGLFLSKDIAFTVQHCLCPKNDIFDWMAVEIHNISGIDTKVIFYSVYRPPNTDIASFIQQFNTSLSKIKQQKNLKIYISSDFNKKMIFIKQ